MVVLRYAIVDLVGLPAVVLADRGVDERFLGFGVRQQQVADLLQQGEGIRTLFLSLI